MGKQLKDQVMLARLLYQHVNEHKHLSSSVGRHFQSIIISSRKMFRTAIDFFAPKLFDYLINKMFVRRTKTLSQCPV